jgi:hypothetical protein
LLSSGAFYEGLLLEDRAHPKNYFEDFLAKRRRNRHRYAALELMVLYR